MSIPNSCLLALFGLALVGCQTSNNDWAKAKSSDPVPPSPPATAEILESTVVEINDRGPYAKERTIDVTNGVAHELDMTTFAVPANVEFLTTVPTVEVGHAS